MSKMSKRKGREGERQAAIFLGGKRIWQHLHDVIGPDGRYWEVKFLKDGFTKLYDALEEHALHYRESGDGPVPHVIVRQNKMPWLVVFYAQDWKDGLCNADPIVEPQE